MPTFEMCQKKHEDTIHYLKQKKNQFDGIKYPSLEETMAFERVVQDIVMRKCT